jgi:hypothetical protein
MLPQGTILTAFVKYYNVLWQIRAGRKCFFFFKKIADAISPDCVSPM